MKYDLKRVSHRQKKISHARTRLDATIKCYNKSLEGNIYTYMHIHIYVYIYSKIKL